MDVPWHSADRRLSDEATHAQASETMLASLERKDPDALAIVTDDVVWDDMSQPDHGWRHWNRRTR